MSKLFSAAEAARETGVSRTTIMRKLAAGEFAQAKKDDDGWRIPLEDLLAAGLNPGRTAPPVRGHDQFEERTATDLSYEVELLRVKLAAAQQLAAEKDRVIEAQAHALRALEAAAPSAVQPESVASDTQVSMPVPEDRPARRGGILGLLGF